MSRQIHYKPTGLFLTIEQLKIGDVHRPLTPEIIMVYRHALQTGLILSNIDNGIKDQLQITLENISF